MSRGDGSIGPPHTDVDLMRRAVRCDARTRQGKPCRAPAVKGKKRCRMHGGAKGSGGQPGNINALKHGYYSKAGVEERQRIRALLALLSGPKKQPRRD